MTFFNPHVGTITNHTLLLRHSFFVPLTNVASCCQAAPAWRFPIPGILTLEVKEQDGNWGKQATTMEGQIELANLMNDVWERCISDMIIRNNFLTSILLKSKSLSSFLIYVKTQTGLLRG